MSGGLVCGATEPTHLIRKRHRSCSGLRHREGGAGAASTERGHSSRYRAAQRRAKKEMTAFHDSGIWAVSLPNPLERFAV